MSINEEMMLLKEIPMFSEIDESKLKLIAFTSERISYQPDEMVFAEGDLTDAIYVIITGEADVRIKTPDGPLSVAIIGKYGIFGEIGVLCDMRRTASVVAHDTLEVLRIERYFFMRLMGDFPSISHIILGVLGVRMASALKFISKVPKDTMKNIMEDMDIDLGGHSGRIEKKQDERHDPV